jgi:outer membrane protein assembly factor BamB
VIVYSEGTGADSGIVGLDLASHQHKWRVSLTAPALGAPVIADGHVFVGVRDRSVLSIDIQTGRVSWTAQTEGIVDASPAVGDGRVFAVSENSASGRARVYALDETTGHQDWSYSPGHFATHVSSPMFGAGHVFVGLGDQTVVALDGSTGAVTWSAPVRGNFSSESVPALAEESVYIADAEGDLYDLNASSGTRRWDYQFDSLVIHGSPLVVGSIVYVGLEDGELTALDSRSGHLVWQSTFSIGAVGPLTPAGGLLLAPLIGARGGVLGLRHDPAASLLDIPSSTQLGLAAALVNFAAAFVLVMAILVGLLQLSARWHRRGGTEQTPEAFEGHT